jgi:hypothetical protein
VIFVWDFGKVVCAKRLRKWKVLFMKVEIQGSILFQAVVIVSLF